MVGGNVVGFYFGGEDTEIADLHIEIDGQGFAFGILPDFKSATALEVCRDAGVPFFRTVVRVREHPFRHRVILQHPHIHLKHVGIPFPRRQHVFRTYSNLLNTNKIKISHIKTV